MKFDSQISLRYTPPLYLWNIELLFYYSFPHSLALWPFFNAAHGRFIRKQLWMYIRKFCIRKWIYVENSNIFLRCCCYFCMSMLECIPQRVCTKLAAVLFATEFKNHCQKFNSIIHLWAATKWTSIANWGRSRRLTHSLPIYMCCRWICQRSILLTHRLASFITPAEHHRHQSAMCTHTVDNDTINIR